MEVDLNNLGRSIVKTPKLYFTDTGLLCHLLRLGSKEELLLSPHKGAVFYLGDITCTINGIKYVSWHDWDSLI